MYTLCKSIAYCPPHNAFLNTLAINQIQSRTEPESEKIYNLRFKKMSPGSQRRRLGVLGLRRSSKQHTYRGPLHTGGGAQRNEGAAMSPRDQMPLPWDLVGTGSLWCVWGFPHKSPCAVDFLQEKA